MRIAVTGRSGQLVSSLFERARNAPDIELIAFGRPEVDLESPGSAAAAIRAAAPDVVINAAAYTAVDQAEDEPQRALRINGEAAGEIAAAASDVGAPVVQISTDYVFDGSSSGPYAEGAETAPLGVYGRSKLEGEQRVRAANPDHVIVRTAWVYSPFGRNFVRTMMAAAATRDRLTVVSDQRGNPSSALDIADGLLAMVRAWRDDPRRGSGEIYHLAGTGAVSWSGFAELIMEECAELGLPSAMIVPIASSEWPTRACRPRNSTLDSSKFESAFGYRMPAWQASAREVVARLARGA